MPGGDGTGPAGMGPMTGRAAGYCAGYGSPGFANGGAVGGRRGWGRGRGGRGRGWRHGFNAMGAPGWVPTGDAPAWGAPPPYARSAPAPEQEVTLLRQQAECFEESLAGIKSRIAELEKAAAEKGS